MKLAKRKSWENVGKYIESKLTGEHVYIGVSYLKSGNFKLSLLHFLWYVQLQASLWYV